MTAVDHYPNASLHLIRILVFIDNETLLAEVVDLLRLHGYAEIALARDPDELGLSLRLSPVDLLVSVSRTDAVFIGHFVHDLRHGLLDCHPFPIVVMILPSAEEHHVRAVIDSGVDDLLINPLDGDALARRLGAFVIDRRPFTVTHQYIGPNRRQANRPGSEVAPLVHVPNPVRARALGFDDAIFQQTLREASLGLSRLKIQRDGRQVAWLLAALKSALEDPEHELLAINALISQIANAAGEIARRAGDRSANTIKAQARKVVEATRAIVFTREAAVEARTKALVGAAQKLTAMIDADF